jgi:hypothetical protein
MRIYIRFLAITRADFGVLGPGQQANCTAAQKRWKGRAAPVSAERSSQREADEGTTSTPRRGAAERANRKNLRKTWEEFPL